jgi:transposase
MENTASNTTANTMEDLKGMLATTQAKLAEAEDKLEAERALRSDDPILIAHLKLVIAKMQREKYGPRSERS